MKYTTEKILDFTSLVYISEQDKACLGYKGALKGWDKQKNTMRLINTANYGIPIIAIGASVVYFIISVTALFNGEANLFSYVGIILNVSLFFYSAKFLGYVYDNTKKHRETWSEYASKLEPKQIWNLDYPHEGGARAKLIKSILGARLINLTLMERTAIPMNRSVIDCRVAHLVTEIAKCTDEDIHSYLEEEATSFCRQAVKDINFYTPIITLQDWLEKQN